MTGYHIENDRLIITDPSLEWLNLRGCTGLTALPDLPGALKRLSLDGCTELTGLPDLPETLERINLRGCTGLAALPDLPGALEWLSLDGCTSLRNWPRCLRWHEKFPLIRSGNRYWAGCVGPLTREDALAYEGAYADHDLVAEYKEIIGRDK